MNMDPLTPTTSTLSPAIAHIADTAASLSKSLQERTMASQETGDPAFSTADPKSKQRQLVRWVLGTPRRLTAMLQQDRKEEAEAEWIEVSQLLDRWIGIDGVDDVRQQCEQILTGQSRNQST